MPPSRNRKPGVPLSLITQFDNHSSYNSSSRKQSDTKQAQELQRVSRQFHEPYRRKETPVPATTAAILSDSPATSIKTDPNNIINIDNVQNKGLDHNYLGHSSQNTPLEIAQPLPQSLCQVLPYQQEPFLNPPTVSFTQINLSALITAINKNNINELQLNDMNLNTIPMDIALYLAGKRAEKSKLAKLAVVNFLREECWRMVVEGMSDFLRYVVGLCGVMCRETERMREG